MRTRTDQSAYCDDSGRPRLRESVTAYIDLLGFSHNIMAAQSREQSQQMLDKIVGAIKDSRSFVQKAFTNNELFDKSRSATKFFSDNVVFGVPCDADIDDRTSATMAVIRCAQWYQLRMALHGLFARGALTCGSICLSDDIIFGPALIEAYRMESKASIVPRVILAEHLGKLLIEHHLAGNDDTAGGCDMICRDIDRWWFVNYLEAAKTPQGIRWDYIEQHKKRVIESLSSTPRHDVLPKFGWVSRYHNVFCHWHRDHDGYSDAYRIERIDENSVIDRLCDITHERST